MNSILNRTIGKALKGWVAALVALVLLLPAGEPAWAQGCAMCYTAAAAARATAIKALRSGILILLVPPGVIFIAILVVAYRRRNSFNEPEESAEASDIRTVLERLERVESVSVRGREHAEGTVRASVRG
jgi:hypothetical protein